MKRLKVVKLNPILKKQICSWDKYKDKSVEGYARIQEFLSHDGLEAYINEYCNRRERQGLAGLLLFPHLGKDIHQLALVEGFSAKGFISFRVDDKRTKNPRIYIQGIAIHPKHQGEGYGSAFMDIILKKPLDYMSVAPTKVYGLVDKDNFRAKKLFEGLGETKAIYYGLNYEYVEATLPSENISLETEVKEREK